MSPVFDSPRTLYRFAAVAVAKTALLSSWSAVFGQDPARVAVAVLSIAATIGLIYRRRWAVALTLAMALAAVASTFPHTLNHGWFELLAAVVLARAAFAPAHRRLRTAVRARVVLQLAILSVFFASGLQKLVHGQFVSGEHLLSTALWGDGELAEHVRRLAGLDAPLPRLSGWVPALGPVAAPISATTILGARLVSIGIVAAELSLPVLVLLRLPYARAMLLTAQIGIGIVSGELGFALTGCATIVLLWPRPPTHAWLGLFAGWVVAVATFWVS